MKCLHILVRGYRNWRGFLLLVFAALLLGCSPGLNPVLESEVRESEAAPTASAATPQPELPEDVSEKLRQMLLTEEDLPIEAGYFLLEPGDSGPFHNTDVVAAWKGTQGWDYMKATGRVDGYFADYTRRSEVAGYPEEFFCNVTQFATPEGARLSLTDYNLVAVGEPGDQTWAFVEDATLELGDAYIVLTSNEVQSDGRERGWYRIEFSLGKYVGVVAAFGWEDQVTPEFMEEAARALLAKIEAAGLQQP